MKSRIYLDWNATAPLRNEARDAMISAMDLVGNPSSVHAEGRAAKALLEASRERISVALGAAPQEVIFMSGATEALHCFPAVVGVDRVSVDAGGHAALVAQATDTETGAALFAMPLANSETGLVNKVPAREGVDGALTLEDGAFQFLGLDVTAALGRVPFAFGWSHADVAALSAHKFGGPKGIGALLLKTGVEIEPLFNGGGHELGRRAGTQNVVAAAGFAAALDAAMTDLSNGEIDRQKALRDEFEALIADQGDATEIIGLGEDRLANTTCLVTPGWKGETQVMRMDLEGFAISAGSACSSGKAKPSSALMSSGFSEVQAQAAVRISIGRDTTRDDIMKFADVWLTARDRHLLKVA